jgi:hypothetical protein
MTTNQEDSTLGLLAEEMGEKAQRVTRNSAGMKRKDGAMNQIQTMAQAYKCGGKSLVLLQVIAEVFIIKPLSSGI